MTAADDAVCHQKMIMDVYEEGGKCQLYNFHDILILKKL